MPRTTKPAAIEKTPVKRKTNGDNGRPAAAKVSVSTAKTPASVAKTPASVAKTPASVTKPVRAHEKVSAEQRYLMIQEAAYLRAERRGFAGGDPVQDWLEAEAEVSARLSNSRA